MTAASCTDVRRALSGERFVSASPATQRAHVDACPDCRRFADDLRRRPMLLRMLYPPLPARIAAAVLERLR